MFLGTNRVVSGEGRKPFRAVLIGCGGIAGGFDERTGTGEVRTHAKAYVENPRTQLVGVMDPDFKKARCFSERWGNAASYTDAKEMLRKESPDIVSIASPDGTHADYLDLCLECPTLKAVWCEKPLTTDIAAAERLVALYEKRNLVLAVNYQRRWDPGISRVREALKKGDLGRVFHVSVFYTGGIFHNASHALDLLWQWFGPKINEVQIFNTIDTEAADPAVVARFLMGEVMVDLKGWTAERDFFEIHIQGSRGDVKLKHFGRRIEWNLPLKTHVEFNDRACAMAHALEEILACSEGRGVLQSSGRTALTTFKLCDVLSRPGVLS